ncbi:hypothetical protein HPL003_11795 [Paenibacillus terrae HPL-003]|uniref:Uncharacterized protein n=1 Tax=Paenibacillus terrae (strain HPL-003) TaxID=985665 RepID=G7W098_PAETH|nr:hypothetical protein HPL003_11795 [Paenibacillus terrae HPL-003]
MIKGEQKRYSGAWWCGDDAVLRGPLRVWKVLTIAVAAGFLDWNNPYRVRIQRQRRTLRFSRILPPAAFLWAALLQQQCLYLFCSHGEEDRKGS